MPKGVEKILESLCNNPRCCRERLIHTAGVFYAERGGAAFSTREITSAAGVNLAAIAYYFGGKKGLQDAVVDHVIETCATQTWGIFEALSEGVEEADGDPDRLASAVSVFVDSFLGAALPTAREKWWVTVLIRAMSSLPSGEEPIYEAVFKPANMIMKRLATAATGETDVDRLGVLSAALAGDFLTFCKTDSVILRSLGWDSYSPDRVEQVIAVVKQRMLGRLGLPRPVANAEGLAAE
jgi:AcrR family transcriptional regulator